MLGFIDILIAIALLVVLVTLGMGFFALYKGGEYGRANSNKFMRYRVMAQGVAIALLLIGFAMKAAGQH